MKKEKVDSWWGWMVVLAAAFNRIIIYGVTYSAGVVYVVVLDVFGDESGITSWISTLITAVMFFTCPLSGYLIEKFGERKVAIVGSLISAIGITSSAFVNSVPVLILTYGVISGIGCGIAFMPGSVAVAKYFKNRRHLALAISSAGGGVGSFAFPPIIEMLNEHYTWRGMFLILGGISLNITVFGALFRPLEQQEELDENSLENEYSSGQSKLQHDDKETIEHLLPNGHKSEMMPLDESKQHNDVSNECGFLSRHSYFKIPSFYILMLNNFMFQFGASVILGHLQAYAVYELHYTPANAALLYTISGVMVLVFKLLHGALANIDYVNIFRPIYQYIFFYLVGGIATICLVIKTSYGVYFYSAIFGMSYAACGGSLIPSLIIDLAGVKTFGVTYGIVLFCLSIGQLMGGPIAGVLYDRFQSYDIAFVLAGSMMTASALLMIYPCLTDLNPNEQFQHQETVELTIKEVSSKEDRLNGMTVFDPISLSFVNGSRTTLNCNSGYSLHNLDSSKNHYFSVRTLQHINGHGSSLESLDIGPRSSSFSVRRPTVCTSHTNNRPNSSKFGGTPQCHPIVSALAIER